MKTARVVLIGTFVATGLIAASSANAVDIPLSEHEVVSGLDRPLFVHTADLDGDGDLDVLGADYNGNDVFWLENDGSPPDSGWALSFVSDSTFTGAYALDTADLDNDGDLDIIGAAELADSAGDDDITWWENTTDGGDASVWTPYVVDTNFAGANFVDAADIDGDGYVDILGAARDGHTISLWRNDGTPLDGGWEVFSEDEAVNSARTIEAVDVNGDGALDILGANYTAGDVFWWENNGTPSIGAWTRHTIDSSFAGAVQIRGFDMDGDGDMDALGVAELGDVVSWWENDGIPENPVPPGTDPWPVHEIRGSFTGARAVDASDLDGDGDLDVLAAAVTDDDIGWWENAAGDGLVWTEHIVNPDFDYAFSVHAADLDGDGDGDFLGVAANTAVIHFWENESIHRAAAFPDEGVHLVDDDFTGPHDVRAADVDGDGDLDLIGAAHLGDVISWWENTDGTGATMTEHTVYTPFLMAIEVDPVDVDGDGDLDILGAAWSDNEIAWFENDGTPGDGAWTKTTVGSGFSQAYSVRGADIDGDGDLDILGAAFDDDDVTWWENTHEQGDGSAWELHSIDGDVDGAISVDVADLDRDGDLDVIAAAYSGNTITWWESDLGAGTEWIEHTIVTDYVQAYSVFATDMNGDGYVDIVGAAYNDNQVTWWENDGSPRDNLGGDGNSWTEHLVDGDFTGAVSGRAADMDNDGDVDVLAAAFIDDDITWWEDTAGDGSMWVEHTVHGDFDVAASVDAADMDGDGDLDIIGAARDENSVMWWENRGGQFALTTTNLAPSVLANGQTAPVLEIEMTHLGRAGDRDLELESLAFMFESTLGTTIDGPTYNALIETSSIMVDNGDGVFEVGSETELTVTSFQDLSYGVQVGFDDGDPSTQVTHGMPRLYFVVAQVKGDASEQTPNTLIFTHLTDALEQPVISTADHFDSSFDLAMAWVNDTASTQITFRRANSEACSDVAVCASGFCIEEMCCDTACGGGVSTDCVACSIANGADADGSCAPLDVTTLCGDAATVCSGQDTCNATGDCLPNHFDSSTPCSDVVGDCVYQDGCDGSGVCVDNGFWEDGAACGDSAADCVNQDTCNSSGACVDNGFWSAATPCATDDNPCSVDECDAIGACGHVAGNAGAECRASVGSCDPAETCDGTSTSCPADAVLDGGEMCDDGDPLTEDDICTPGGLCAGAFILGTCGAPIDAVTLPYDDSNTTTGQPSGLDSYGADCGGASQTAPDVAYEVELLAGDELEVWVDPTADYDVAIRLIAACQNDEVCLASVDDEGADGDELLTYTASEDITVYVVVEGAAADESGDFIIAVSLIDSSAGDEGDIVADGGVDMTVDAAEPEEHTTSCGCLTTGRSTSHGLIALLALLALGVVTTRYRF